MDAAKRLTKIEEWKRGRRYQWYKGGERGPVAVCLRTEDNRVVLKEEATGAQVTQSPLTWSNRWIEV